MGRSVKKGPYVQELVTHSQFTTDVSTFLYM